MGAPRDFPVGAPRDGFQVRPMSEKEKTAEVEGRCDLLTGFRVSSAELIGFGLGFRG